VKARHGRFRPAARVLVVDDDEVIRQLIAVHLKIAGVKVGTAFDGQDALERVADFKPDVITIDALMPRLDGWQTAARLRSDPATASIRIVVLTPRLADRDLAAARPGYVDACLAKPFDPGELVVVVCRLAASSRAGP